MYSSLKIKHDGSTIRNAPVPRDGSAYSRGTTPLGSRWNPLKSPAASVDAIGYPDNAGPAERATCWSASFTRQLRSELPQTSPEWGSQSTAPPPWRTPSAYSSPSSPFLVLKGIIPQKPRFVKLRDDPLPHHLVQEHGRRHRSVQRLDSLGHRNRNLP
jgi:hypothetical protein